MARGTDLQIKIRSAGKRTTGGPDQEGSLEGAEGWRMGESGGLTVEADVEVEVELEVEVKGKGKGKMEAIVEQRLERGLGESEE